MEKVNRKRKKVFSQRLTAEELKLIDEVCKIHKNLLRREVLLLVFTEELKKHRGDNIE